MSAALEIGKPVTVTRRKSAKMNTIPIGLPPTSANSSEKGGQILTDTQVCSVSLRPELLAPAAPIAAVKPPRRQRQTNTATIPIEVTSVVAPFEPVATPARKLRARKAAIPTATSPGALPIIPDQSARDTHWISVGVDGGGHVANPAALPVAEIVRQLMQHQRRRKHAIRAQMKLNAMTDSLLASLLGYRLDQPEKQRKAAFAKAHTCRKAVEDAVKESQPLPALPEVIRGELPMILATMRARAEFDAVRDQAVASMEALAKQLPVWTFVKSVRGLSELGLAVIVAEAGQPNIGPKDEFGRAAEPKGSNGLGDFFTVSGLWKHMGYAVINGRSQRKVSGDAALEQGYAPQRHAEVYAFCDDIMFRSQWAGAESGYRKAIKAHPAAAAYCAEHGVVLKDLNEDKLAAIAAPFGIVVEARPLGPYGVVYQQRRAETAPWVAATASLPDAGAASRDKWTPGRCSKDGRRLMTKALLLDLWRVWNGKPPQYV